jgi:hypothetical protein
MKNLPIFDSSVSRIKPISILFDRASTLEQKYRSRYTKACWHCGYLFDNPPYPEPTQYDIQVQTFIPSGYFCSPSCVLGKILHQNQGYDQQQQIECFWLMMKHVYQILNVLDIVAAPKVYHFENRGLETGQRLTYKAYRELYPILPHMQQEVKPFQDTMNVVKTIVTEIELARDKKMQLDAESKFDLQKNNPLSQSTLSQIRVPLQESQPLSYPSEVPLFPTLSSFKQATREELTKSVLNIITPENHPNFQKTSLQHFLKENSDIPSGSHPFSFSSESLKHQTIGTKHVTSKTRNEQGVPYKKRVRKS